MSGNTKKDYAISDGLSLGKGGLPEEVYLRSYYASECRPIGELVDLWKPYRKFHKFYDFEKWLAQRDRLRKDVYELALYLGKDFVPHVHKEMCDQFVKKNFDGVYHEGFTLTEVRQAIGRQEREHEMLLLAPRGAFKSTADGVDCVSWMLNVPDVRIFIITGEVDLAVKFLKEVKGYFYCAEKTEPTKFQALFPEYIVTGDMGVNASSLFCPARLHQQEENASLWVNSIGARLSGWHCDIFKGDDPVNDKNSNTEHTRASLKNQWDNALNLVDEWGFIDQIGTRYFVDDLWGERIKIMDEVPLKYLRRQSWTVKPEFKDVALRDLKEHMVDLYFPEKLTWKSLRAKLYRNEQQFLCQQMNEPAMGEELVHFDEDQLRRSHMPDGAMPTEGSIYITFDTSAGSKGGDFSCGAVGRIVEENKALPELYVMDVNYGKWKASELALQIVKTYMKWPMAKVVMIEDFVNSELLKREVNTLAMRFGIQIPIMWIKPEQGNNAKKNRIAGLEIMLSEGTLFFANGWWTDELIKQFTKYTGAKASRRHDDIPDAIAYLQKFMPSPDASSEYAKLKAEQQKKMIAEQFASHVFRAPTPAPFFFEEDEEKTDPANRSIDDQFFGGNGMSLWRN
jgi:predicted phage terminase large subunit-like protein